MITLALHDQTHIALRNAYEWRKEIAALATRPDVRFDADARAWLVHVALLDKLYFCLGDVIAPASADFWLDCPLYTPAPPKPVRRTKAQIMAEKRKEQAAAGRFGRVIVEAMHREER